MGSEKFMEGQFSPSEKEIMMARAAAEEKGEDPDEAEAKLRTKMSRATGRLRENQAEEATDRTLE